MGQMVLTSPPTSTYLVVVPSLYVAVGFHEVLTTPLTPLDEI